MNEMTIEDSLIDLKLAVKDVNVILASLSKQQYDVVADLIENIKSQGIPQVAELEKSVTEEATD